LGGEACFGRAVEAAAARAVGAAGVEAPDRTVVAAPDARMADGAVSEFPDAPHDSTFDSVGYAGCATFALDVAHTLEEAEAGETALAVAYGPGGADAVALGVESPGAGAGLSVAELLDSKEYVTYSEHLEYRERVDYEGVTLA
jgi:3-hydroxy-3-methylglutaryl CoA synthase